MRARLEHVAGHALHFLLDDCRGAGDRAGHHHRVAAAAGTGSGQPVIAIRISHTDVRRVHAQLLGQHHCRDGLGTIAPTGRVQRDHRLAGRVDFDRGALGRARQRKPGIAVEHPELGGAEHALFLAGGDADADIAALGARQLLLFAPAVVVEHLQRHVERAGIIAAVVQVAGRDLIRKLLRPDEIGAAERDRIEAEFVDSGIDHALDHEIRDFGAETAAGALLAFVGEDRIDFRTDRADLVGTDGLRKPVAVGAEPVLKIGAVIIDDPVAQRRHVLIGVDRQFRVVDAVGAVIVARRDVVDAVLDVFDRPAARARTERRQHRHLVQKKLAAETAAGVDRHQD